jgi:hypothetical protein
MDALLAFFLRVGNIQVIAYQGIEATFATITSFDHYCAEYQ